MTKKFRYIVLSVIIIGSIICYSCSEEFLTREPIGIAAGSVISYPEGVEKVLI